MNIKNLMSKTRRMTEHGDKYYIPDYSNSVGEIPKKLQSFVKKPSKTIVFMMDAINYFEFQKHFKDKIDLSGLEPLMSVFPSGSPTSWSEILFNSRPQKHGVYGIAFYMPKYKGIYNICADKIVDSYNNELGGKVDYAMNCKTIFDIFTYSTYFIHLDHFWFKTKLWNKYLGKRVKRIGIKPSGTYKEDYDRKGDLDRVLETAIDLSKTKGNKCVWASIDFDLFMHKYGVKTTQTQNLLKHVSNCISEFVQNCKDYNFVFLSDHGQIDLSGAYEFNYESIEDRCYAPRGGMGRTYYFYSKDERVYNNIKQQISRTGLVLRKADPELKRLFGFDPVTVPQVGDVVAIATRPSFPSYSWDMAAEHGGLSKEEMFVPFMIIKSQ